MLSIRVGFEYKLLAIKNIIFYPWSRLIHASLIKIQVKKKLHSENFTTMKLAIGFSFF